MKRNIKDLIADFLAGIIAGESFRWFFDFKKKVLTFFCFLIEKLKRKYGVFKKYFFFFKKKLGVVQKRIEDLILPKLSKNLKFIFSFLKDWVYFLFEKINLFYKKVFIKLKKIFSQKLKKVERIEIPLFFSLFGWQPRFTLVKIKRTLLWPFKKYWQQAVTGVLVVAFFVVIGTAVYNYSTILGATYHWTQGDWSGGESGEKAAHEGDKTGWTKYSEKDEEIEAGSDLELKLIPELWLQISEEDFLQGEFSTTTIEGTGDEASIRLEFK